MSRRPIADYALLSDCHSAALVARDGSLDWLCYPRFDSPALFARILDQDAGHWSIHPVGDAAVARRYVEDTMALETTFRTPGGTVRLTDALVIGPNHGGHELGAAAPHVLVRVLECTDGEVTMELDYRPRPEYGLVAPLVTPMDGGVLARGGADVLALSSQVPLEIHDANVRADFRVRAGDRLGFAVQHRSSWEAAPEFFDPHTINRMLTETVAGWRNWHAQHQAYEGPWRELVHRSGSVLQALTYQPTGAIVAAPTTSLPEVVGGVRNWDYRYSWVRDASLTIDALWVAACPDEAHVFFAWMAGAAATSLQDRCELQIMFGVGGEHDLTERELPHLAGWRDSRPVRVGNAAWSQVQLDVYGEILGAAHRLAPQLDQLSEATCSFLAAAADAAAAGWTEPDEGIWEVRGDRRHFLYSKLMCWRALDAAVELAPFLDARDHVRKWTRSREEIRAAILERGWSETARAFTQALGSDDLDASALTIPIVGFLPPDDPRVLATIEAIESHLTDERGLVRRYRAPDGLPGQEGSFLLCTFWLAQAQAMAGRVDAARATFARAAAHASDLGLLAEEVDSSTGELAGNFPQAFSHVGLVNAAWAIAEAERAPLMDDQEQPLCPTVARSPRCQLHDPFGNGK